ncbi:MAG: hypothetical protein Q9162_003096 [Coniocarpon cinnabarinum]
MYAAPSDGQQSDSHEPSLAAANQLPEWQPADDSFDQGPDSETNELEESAGASITDSGDQILGPGSPWSGNGNQPGNVAPQSNHQYVGREATRSAYDCGVDPQSSAVAGTWVFVPRHLGNNIRETRQASCRLPWTSLQFPNAGLYCQSSDRSSGAATSRSSQSFLGQEAAWSYQQNVPSTADSLSPAAADPTTGSTAGGMDIKAPYGRKPNGEPYRQPPQARNHHRLIARKNRDREREKNLETARFGLRENGRPYMTSPGTRAKANARSKQRLKEKRDHIRETAPWGYKPSGKPWMSSPEERARGSAVVRDHRLHALETGVND